MRIRVLVINRKKNVYDISNAISSNIKYTTTRVGSASTISFDVVKSGQMSFHEGDMVKIFVDTLHQERSKFVQSFTSTFSTAEAETYISLVVDKESLSVIFNLYVQLSVKGESFITSCLDFISKS